MQIIARAYQRFERRRASGAHVPGALAALLVLAACLLAAGGAAMMAQQAKNGTRNPHGPIKIGCENCHTSTSWSPIRPHPDFDHKATRYPLRGMHVGVDCRQCHIKLVFSQAGMECADCHADIHRRQLGGNCESCHTVRGWRVSLQSLNNHQNRFPLLGAHAAVDCQSCHTSAAVGLFRGLSTTCASCHIIDYQAAKLPDHVTLGFPATCEMCHRADSFLGARFDHAKFANFQLTGIHGQLACADCHPGNRFTGAPTDCYSCHATDFTGATNPNHVSAGLSRDCTLCHTTAGWAGAHFNHATTGFTLTGMHAAINCNQCHVNNKFTGTAAACASCHLADYNATNNPKHAASGLGANCDFCHTANSWLGAVFDHGKTTFPLTGAHAAVNCTLCHINSKFAGTPTQCVNCHLTDFSGATNPKHAAAGFPQDCTICHTTTRWQGATFVHSKTGFILTGVHTTLTCNQCHADNRFAGTSAACIGCHQTDYNATKNPNHAQAGFPADCSLCHATTTWQGAVFDHSKTKFPLTGAHSPLKCLDCHAGGQYATLPTTCVTCHLARFNSTTNPKHTAAGFPQDCSICHNTATFSTSTFNHNATPFPLTGAHGKVPCLSCHINNVFASTPIDCFSCHSAVYKSTTNPKHTTAGFPTTCQTCHTTTKWTGATFNHTYFPQKHGNAKVCSDCHPNANNYAVFQCTNCHTQSQANGKHKGVGGYVYNSINCYQCHPRGSGG